VPEPVRSVPALTQPEHPALLQARAEYRNTRFTRPVNVITVLVPAPL
jgi:hypothetical protein